MECKAKWCILNCVQIDHPPLFILHLKDEGGPVTVTVDLEFK